MSAIELASLRATADQLDREGSPMKAIRVRDAADEIEELRGRVADLTAERDDARRRLQSCAEEVCAWERENVALAARIEAARDAVNADQPEPITDSRAAWAVYEDIRERVLVALSGATEPREENR